MVLISLGIIFLPSLFYRDNDERVVVNTTSLIPPKPAVRTIVIVSPERTTQTSAPTPDKAFQPSSITDRPVVDEVNKVKAQPSAKAPSKKAAESTLTLGANGLPRSWVIQAASFKSEEHAKALSDKLRAKKYKAYVRGVKTSNGKFFRVLVGPYIDKQRAATAKVSIDKAYRVKGQILQFSSN
jgi:DedD protein